MPAFVQKNGGVGSPKDEIVGDDQRARGDFSFQRAGRVEGYNPFYARYLQGGKMGRVIYPVREDVADGIESVSGKEDALLGHDEGHFAEGG